jgi:antitoxin HicB
MSRFYEIILEPDDNDTFLVTAPALPEVTSFGETEADALHWGELAIEEVIAARMSDQWDVPMPGARREDGWFVEMPLLIYLKIALYNVTRARGITRAELCRRMGAHRASVERLFDLNHHSRFDQMEAAFKALDVPIDVHVALAA